MTPAEQRKRHAGILRHRLARSGASAFLSDRPITPRHGAGQTMIGSVDQSDDGRGWSAEQEAERHADAARYSK